MYRNETQEAYHSKKPLTLMSILCNDDEACEVLSPRSSPRFLNFNEKFASFDTDTSVDKNEELLIDGT